MSELSDPRIAEFQLTHESFNYLGMGSGVRFGFAYHLIDPRAIGLNRFQQICGFLGISLRVFSGCAEMGFKGRISVCMIVELSLRNTAAELLLVFEVYLTLLENNGSPQGINILLFLP